MTIFLQISQNGHRDMRLLMYHSPEMRTTANWFMRPQAPADVIQANIAF